MRTLVVTLTALLLAAAPAEAKQIEKVVVCGDGHQCTTLENGRDGDLMVFANGGPPVDGPTAPGAFYRVRMTMLEPDTSARHRWTNIWVPGLERVANYDGSWQWTATLPAQATALERAARGLQPFPASRMPGVVRAPAPAPAPAPPEHAPIWPWLVGVALLVAALAGGLTARARTTRRSGPRAPRPSGQRAA